MDHDPSLMFSKVTGLIGFVRCPPLLLRSKRLAKHLKTVHYLFARHYRF